MDFFHFWYLGMLYWCIGVDGGWSNDQILRLGKTLLRAAVWLAQGFFWRDICEGCWYHSQPSRSRLSWLSNTSRFFFEHLSVDSWSTKNVARIKQRILVTNHFISDLSQEMVKFDLLKRRFEVWRLHQVQEQLSFGAPSLWGGAVINSTHWLVASF